MSTTNVFRNYREEFKLLLEDAKLRTIGDKTRDLKSLRPTGISLRLDATENPDYRDVAKWCRSSPPMIAAFYDQTHPEASLKRIIKTTRKKS